MSARARSYALFLAAFGILAMLTGYPLQGARLLLGLLVLAFHGEAILALASREKSAANAQANESALFRPFFSMAIGQWFLLTFFAACSAFAHFVELPQLTLIPFVLLPFASAVLIARERYRAGTHEIPSAPTAAPWARRDTFLNLTSITLLLFPIFYVAGAKFGQWQLPSSDPDIHALHARISALAGGFFFEIPRSDVPVTYPQGFALLNGLWLKLTGLSPLHIVGIQPYLQYGLGFALLWGALAPRFEGKSRRLAAFTLVAVLLLNVIAHPVLPADRALLEGTSRLAHFGLVLQTLALLADGVRRRQGIVLGAVLAALCCAWTVSFNPAHVPVTGILILLAGAPLLSNGLRQNRRRALFALACGAVTLALVQVMHLWTDPYLAAKFLGRGELYFPNMTALNTGASKMEPVFRLPDAATLRDHFSKLPQEFALLWKRTTPDPGAELGFFLTVVLSLALLARKRSRQTALESAIPFGLVAGLFLLPWALSAVTHSASPDGQLFAKYTEAYSRQWIVLVVGIWMLLVWTQAWTLSNARLRHPRRVGMAVPLVLLALYFPFLRAHAQWIGSRLQTSSLSYVSASDLRLIEWIRSRLKPEDRVLLLGMYWGLSKEQQDTPEGMKKESWIFPMGVARDLPILTDQATAFFYMIDGRDYTAFAYRDHVWGGLDLDWVDRHGLKWILGIKASAPHDIGAGFRPCIQTERAALWIRSTDWNTWRSRCEAGLTSGPTGSP